MDMRENLETMLASGRDNALLRFTLGELYLNDDQAEKAAGHLQRAVEQDPEYSAAWKLYGKALAAGKRDDDATEAFEKGIAVAEKRGDQQAAKEMRVFLKRLKNKEES